MNITRNIRRYALIPFFIFTLFLASSVTVMAGKEPAPALPESGLPALPDYTSDSSRARNSMPARYDSREKGYVTSVKDQSPFGTCWAFGALSAGESSMLRKGRANSSIDLSEMHLSYFFFRCLKDPLGLTAGDSVKNYTGDNYLNTGGNNIFTMFALSKWTGAASESLVPYSGYQSYINESYAYNDVAHLQNARFVNTNDRTSVKKLITEYGAVSTSIFYYLDFQNSNGAYLFPYYGNGTNHVVSIVGWDDNYSKNNFSAVYKGQTIKPRANGAWIVKNSYGTGEGDQGYIYISYEDVSVCSSGGDKFSFAFDMESANNYDHNYQYDGSFGSGYMTSQNNTSISNVYKTKGNSGGNEKLKAVSFSLLTQNVNYSIQIYKNPPSSNPTGGSPIFVTPQTGKTTYSGYYTIPLKKQPVFNQGDTFSVVITLRSQTSSNISFFVDYSDNANELEFISSSSPNQSFYKSSSTSGWRDLNDFLTERTARIKAFTSNTKESATKVDMITSTLKTPTIATLKSTSYNKTQLKWKAVKNAKNYQIYRSTSKYGTYQKIGTTSRLTFTDYRKVSGITYHYKIRATRTLKGKTVYSRFSYIKSITPRPGKVKLTRLDGIGNKKVRLKWKKVSGANGYEIYRSNSKNRGYKRIKILKKGSQISYVNKIPKIRTYYYKVRSYRNVNGRKVYGTYSTPKKVVVKR